MVDVQKAVAECREAAARDCFFDDNVPNRSSVQKRVSIYSWNPGFPRGKAGAIEKQIAGKWHVITLQEAVDYVDHELLTNRFHVTDYGGCTVLFNKDTFFPQVEVKSIFLHDTRRELPDKVMAGDQGWVLQGVLSRASFRRPPLSGQKTFTVLSLHISNIYAPKRGIAKKLILTVRAIMIDQQIDLWQVISMEQHGDAATEITSVLSTKLLQTLRCQRRRALHLCGDPDRFKTTGLTTVGSLNRLIQIGIGKCACMVPSPSHVKLSACVQPIKVAIMRHGSTWISSIGAIPNHITENLTDEFYSKSVLRRTITPSRKGASAIS